jgi:hypothetical protein
MIYGGNSGKYSGEADRTPRIPYDCQGPPFDAMLRIPNSSNAIPSSSQGNRSDFPFSVLLVFHLPSTRPEKVGH